MVRRFLAEKSPVNEVRRLMATDAGYDPAVWAQLGQLGLAGLTIPEEAYYRVAASNIQVHGGIGFTWEHDAHLYYRRAKSAEVMLGTPASHREIVASLLLNAAG